VCSHEGGDLGDKSPYPKTSSIARVFEGKNSKFSGISYKKFENPPPPRKFLATPLELMIL